MAEEKKDKKQAPKAKIRYKGPHYQNGLVVRGIPKPIRPNDWEEDKAREMIRLYPVLTTYFET
jgi:hypothetical protein